MEIPSASSFSSKFAPPQPSHSRNLISRFTPKTVVTAIERCFVKHGAPEKLELLAACILTWMLFIPLIITLLIFIIRGSHINNNPSSINDKTQLQRLQQLRRHRQQRSPSQQKLQWRCNNGNHYRQRRGRGRVDGVAGVGVAWTVREEGAVAGVWWGERIGEMTAEEERGEDGGERLPTYEETQKGLPGYEKVESGEGDGEVRGCGGFESQ
ncbi:hypothetical protein EX30DRAFT_348842 [Ascodesmis nigricans]|uniref:Uncharacterized protein n=1 Tax=Ascodesmis nigricans TaxID=341454 RepID=A0A4S2MXE3_9PEZI|nr:hypothetical protein EX30DRAFT_348842 [Ascodesmis nigricans]